MKRSDRIAITRIITDLIKADNIIDAGEMAYYAQLKEEYAINKDIEQAAVKTTLSDAVCQLAKTDDRVKDRFLEHCNEMTVSDGFCAPQEALLVMSLQYSLNECCESAEVISVPLSNFSIGKGQVLFVESNYNERINKAIKHNYRTIDNEFRLAGFNFIYIPHIIKHYVQYRDDIFSKVANFLAPHLTEDEIMDLMLNLTSMTTARFCREQLCERLGMRVLADSVPSLLVKVNDNIVGDKFYENFFRIDLNKDCLSLIRRLMDGYVGMLNADTHTVSHIDEKENQFLYYGFYRQLFDMYTIRDVEQCTIEINPYQGEIRLPEINKTLPFKRRKEKSFYMLLLVESAKHGGINFNLLSGKKQFELYQSKMADVMKMYKRIYGAFGGEDDRVPDITRPEIRRPIISNVRKIVDSLQNVLHDTASYNIAKNGIGFFHIPLDEKRVKILTSKGFVSIDEWLS